MFTGFIQPQVEKTPPKRHCISRWSQLRASADGLCMHRHRQKKTLSEGEEQRELPLETTLSLDGANGLTDRFKPQGEVKLLTTAMFYPTQPPYDTEKKIYHVDKMSAIPLRRSHAAPAGREIMNSETARKPGVGCRGIRKSRVVSSLLIGEKKVWGGERRSNDIRWAGSLEPGPKRGAFVGTR
ncbi:hypothetical protein BDP81DRAFT_31558 [Colletotrichum phormii]|uniref:Uncharacterized protein n=1 Tax=Colletotrichum phormii TaxID=359342 RepID=A0AAI9ZPS1_9PEZI|nr:uncharacterized protein BDP81DRAFT_31558 [Colletotrichum phormii]KAK1635941.1 hypothetical protein BDP81DRAFT_31558 [Colletotrichum phormii]